MELDDELTMNRIWSVTVNSETVCVVVDYKQEPREENVITDNMVLHS